MFKIIDRKSKVAPAAVDPAVANESRMRRRQQMRVQLQRRKEIEDERANYLEQAAECKKRIDAAVAAHAAETAPLQAELQALQQASAKRAGERLPPEESDYERRREIVKAIGECNRKLEETCLIENRMRESLNAQSFNLRDKLMAFGDADEGKLARAPLANPKWLLEHGVMQSRVKFARMRLREAAEEFDKCKQFGYADSADPDERSRYLRWQAERADASAQLGGYARRVDELHRMMIEE